MILIDEPRKRFLVFALVISALLLLSTVPYWSFRNLEMMRRENDDVIEPSRNLAARYEVAMARGRLDEADRALARLEALAPQTSAGTAASIAALSRAAASKDAEAIRSASTRLQQQLRVVSRANRTRMMEAQNRAIAWSVALFMLTLFSVLAVVWLLWHQRLLIEQVIWAHKQSDRDARDEQALRAAAAAVAAPLNSEEVVREIARGALQASNADAAFAARLESGNIMRVIAVAGKTSLSIDTELAYADTVIARIIESGSATVVENSRFDAQATQAVVVPLIEDQGPIGVLTLLYENQLDEATLPLLLARASTFGDLAAVALRKTRLLEQAEDRRRKLEAVEQSRARLLRGFSHDIKNPLSNADGFLQLLELGLRGPLSHQQLKTLQRARMSLNTGLRMLRDLLDFAVASVGRISLTITQASIKEVVAEVVENYRAAAEQKDITLRMDAGVYPEMRTDIDRVRQVVDNLISNAVKYTREGGEIIVSGSFVESDLDSSRWARIEVRDNGIGIPPEFHDKVFQEFTRLQPFAEPGAGIGLAISQSLANALGGRITLASEVGQGSTFALWLPTTTRPESIELIG
jgi:signal transduction histidine kinase